jgi:hypothetical protein
MGAVNGSTAATTAVTSFNGRTGAVQGVSAAVAGDGIAVSGATGAVTITNTGVTRAVAGTGISVSGATGSVTITNIGVQSFNGNTGAVTGASLGANTFTALNTFNSGISANSLYVTNGITFGGSISFTDPLYFNLNSDTFSLLNLGGSVIQLGWTAGANINISNDGESAVRIYGNTVTTTGTFSGVTADFTGLVSSTVGFSGSGANLKGIVTSFNGLSGAVQGVSAAVAGTGISVSGATGSVTITNIGVQSFNGLTGAVTGASLGANTFTGLNTFNAGITTAFIYASTGSTFAGTLQVNGGATFAATANFTNGLTSSGSIRFRGTATKNIHSNQAPIFIQGITSGAAASYNSITLPVDNSALLLGSATGNVTIVNNFTSAAVPGLRILTDDQDFIGSFGTVIKPISYATAERTQTLQDASGTIALTSQLMGTVNGSTAATTAVTSFNGRTGAVQGVSAAVAGTGISVSGATGAVTITNTGVQSFNGLTGAVTGASLGANTFTALNTFNAGISAAGGTFSALTRFTAGISASALTVSGGVTFSGNVSLGDLPTGLTADSNDYVRILNTGANNYRSGIYRSYKTLAGATSGVVCTTPADSGSNTVNTFEVTLEYYQTGFATTVAVHKFWVVVTYNSGGTISDFDYTESIVKGAFTTLVPFTISVEPTLGLSLNITAAAPANTGKYSGWLFLTTVRVY